MVKMETLLEIFSIPLLEEWEGYIDRDSYTICKYWKTLGLLNEAEFSKVFHSKKMETNPRILNYFKSLNYHFHPRYYFNEKVADVGSGFGSITFWLVLNGAEIVYSIGDPKRISFIERLYQSAVARNLIDDKKIIFKPAFIKVGDTTLFDAIKDNSLGMVLLNDTLEHITPRIFPSLVKSSSNNLKLGGVFISKQQNTDSPKMLDKLRSVWEKSEKEFFINQRFEIIIKEMPNIDKSNAKILAIKTRGLDSVDFYNAINEFKENEKYPNHNLDVPPIDIETDVPYEGDTSIKRIFSEFKSNGFRKIEVYPDLLSSRRSKYFQPLARAIPKFFMSNHIFDQTSVFVMTK